MTQQLSTTLTKNTALHRCVCIGFFVLLLVPLMIGVLSFGGGDESLVGENRNKEAWPEATLLKSDFTVYTAQVNRFMSDHIGLREWLLKLHAKFRYRILNRTVSDKATIGRNGWLFYSEGGALENANDASTFGEAEATAWIKPLLEYQRLIKRHGGKLVLMLVPEKHHVYSEYLPPRYSYARDGRRADVVASLAERSDVSVINLLNPMLAAKASGQLYLKSDSHWTQRGAYIAYQELVNELRQQNMNVPFASWQKLQKMDSITGSGDLAMLLNLSDEFEEEYERYIPVHKQERDFIETLNRPSLLLIGDSFSARLHDFLPSSFVGTLFVHHRFRSLPTAVVTKRKPDVVVIEVIERSLDRPFIISD